MSSNGKIVIIVGSGRSGTSLLANILLELGMGGSDEYVKPNKHNPEGFFEDQRIVDIHNRFYEVNGISMLHYLDENSLGKLNFEDFGGSLRKIVKRNVDRSKGVWGFKDPKTTSLLPLWQSHVIGPLNLEAKYILSIRNPASVVKSLAKQNIDERLAELLWLVRTCNALYYTAGGCFVVHYEDWFSSRSENLATDMSKFIGLSDHIDNGKLRGILKKVVKNDLNRSTDLEYKIKNPLVTRLYVELQKYSGDSFDKDSLMSVVGECREVIESFSAWIDLPESQPKKSIFEKLTLKLKDPFRN